MTRFQPVVGRLDLRARCSATSLQEKVDFRYSSPGLGDTRVNNCTVGPIYARRPGAALGSVPALTGGGESRLARLVACPLPAWSRLKCAVGVKARLQFAGGRTYAEGRG